MFKFRRQGNIFKAVSINCHILCLKKQRHAERTSNYKSIICFMGGGVATVITEIGRCFGMSAFIKTYLKLLISKNQIYAQDVAAWQ